MSTFEDDRYQWRDTYFVLFESSRRPVLAAVKEAVLAIGGDLKLSNCQEDANGLVESLTIYAAEDFAALDVSYLDGEEVVAERDDIVAELKRGEAIEPEQLAHLSRCNARFDVMHFELIAGAEADEDDGMLDPGSLLSVLDVLAKLTGGIVVDPQSGTLL